MAGYKRQHNDTYGCIIVGTNFQKFMIYWKERSSLTVYEVYDANRKTYEVTSLQFFSSKFL